MSGPAYLASGPLNLAALRDHSRNELLACLDSAGTAMKALVLDEGLVGPLGLIAEYSLLKEHGVDKLFQLESRLETSLQTVIYFVRPAVTTMRTIAAHIKANERKFYHIFFVPRRTTLCEDALKQEGVYGNVAIGEYELDLLPLDNDLLSLEMINAYRDCHLNGDRTSLFYVARSIIKLQSVFGVIPKVYGKGKCTKYVADMIARMLKEQAGLSGVEGKGVVPEIDSLVLLDREIDRVTPLCTQLTYEGLVDEVFRVVNGYVALPPNMLPSEKAKAPTQGPPRKVKVALNSGDTVYEEIRDLNFAHVAPLLSKRAKKINAEYEERHGAKTVSQIKDFIARLSNIQAEHHSLGVHTNIAEKIMERTRGQTFLTTLESEQMFISGVDTDKFNDYLEDLICKQEPFYKVLRLICLQSLTNGGLKPKVLDAYRREILQTYGYEHLETLYNYQRLGLLSPKTDSYRYDTVRKGLRLVVDDIDESNPNDMAYVFSGYAPISVRLVERLQSGSGWRGLDHILRELPGPNIELTQALPGQKQKTSMTVGTVARDQRPKVTLVFFLGGVTFAEIAAIRFLAKQSEGQREYVIATTGIINGDTFLTSLSSDIPSTGLTPIEKRQSHYVD